MKNDRLLKKFLKQEGFDTEFLTKFPQNDGGNVTVIVSTYNRSPYKKLEKNPLYWYLRSVFNQRLKPSQIIIVNDGSSDYTKNVVDFFRKKGNIDITYILHRVRKGLPKSFDTGLSAATSQFVYYTDDDCIIAPHTIWGAKFTLTKMLEADKNTALISLPVYQRATIPAGAISKSEIGKIDLNEGKITGNFDCFPSEYLLRPRYIDKERKILLPFKIRNLGFHQIARTEILREVGVPIDFDIPNYWSWEGAFGLKILDAGYDYYFQPDPKFHAFHESYGSPKPKVLTGIDWLSIEMVDGITFKEVISESSRKNLNTGARVSKENWYSYNIRGRLRILYPKSVRAARKWARYSYKEFVVKNNKNLKLLTVPSIRKRVKREEIWEEAVRSEIGEKELSALKLHPEIKLK